MRRSPALTATAAAAALLATPAAADGRCEGPVIIAEAVRIAATAGLVRAEKVECDDGKWEVEGRDARGREIEVDVDPRSGRILKVGRDD